MLLQLIIVETASGQIVDFSQTVISDCSPKNVVFTDISSGGGGIVSRKWNLDNGNLTINNSLSVQETYVTPRTYNIKLVVLFADGTLDSLTKKLVIHPNPVADFDADATISCAPATIHFTDKSTTSTGTINDRKWDLDLSTSTDKNPDQRYINTGSYKINLIVTNSWGCFTTISKPGYIKVVNKPHITFDINPKNTCKDTLTIVADNKSVDAPNYLWDFGDNITSILENQPPHFYASPGSYKVSLSSFIATGCEDKDSTVVNIGKPVAEIVDFTDTVCEKSLTSFKGKAGPSGAMGYWLFGDKNTVVNNTQASYTFVNSGTFDVFFIAVNSWGCTDTVKEIIYVKPRPVIDITISPQNTCNDSLTVFFNNNNTKPLNLLWNFGDGNKTTQVVASHFYALPGSYNLIIRDTSFGCGSIITKSINVGKPHPEIISFRDTVCKDQSDVFIGKFIPSDASGKWFFSDKNLTFNGNTVNYSFTVPGTYNVYFIAANPWGCTDTIKKSIYVSGLPEPLFSIDTVRSCKIPFTIQTINQTIGNNLEFTWNFGDGKPSEKGFEPSHTYTAFGNFDVTLTAKDTSSTAGCTSTLIKKNIIHINPPTARITVGTFRSCNPPVDISFTVATTGFIDPPTKYIWDLGDNTSDTTQVPVITHTYTRSGSFIIKAIIASGSGCSALASLAFTILNSCPPPPDTVIQVTYSCFPCNRITLTDTVLNSTVTSWDFGDGIIINSNPPKSVTHLFPADNSSYSVKVERKNNTTGRISGTSVMVYIQCLAPQIQSDKAATCTNDSIQFIPVNVDSTILKQYTWIFGDGGSSQLTNLNTPPYIKGTIRHAYKSTGTYNIQLLITDNRGCTFSSPGLPVIIEGPKANFSSSLHSTCDSLLTVFFKDSTTLNHGIPIVKWEWNFGDGLGNYTSLQDTVIRRRYKGNTVPVNNHNVSLMVTDSLGCTGPVAKTKYIALYHPDASFTSNDTFHCNNYQVSFINRSRASSPTYTWYMGDWNIIHDVNPVYKYKKDSLYNIKLVVKDENGCLDSSFKEKYIKIVKPVANMRIEDSSICWPKLPITFKDSSTYAFKYLWDFGDGRSLSQDKDRSRIYDAPGVYTVKLIVTGPDGCKDTTSQKVKIKGAKGTASADSLKGCVPFETTMKVSNSINVREYAWTFGDGTGRIAASRDSIIKHTYDRAGTYVPRVIYRSPEGCETGDSTKPIVIDFIQAKFSVAPDVFCEKGIAVIIDSSRVSENSVIIHYTWDFGNGQKSNLPKPVAPVYSKSGNYTIQLAVESRLGCRDTFKLPEVVKVYALPVLNITGLDSSCQNTMATFRAQVQSEDSVSSLKWLLNGTVIGISDSVRLNFIQPGSSNLTLQVQTKHGCSAILTKDILIHPTPNPIPNANPDTTVCVNSTVKLRASGGVSYLWSPAGTLLFPNSPTAIARPLPGTTMYSVIITNEFGCTVKDSVTIKTDDSVFVNTIPVEEVCISNGISLQATSNTTKFLWSPAENLKNANSLKPVAFPTTNTLYRIIGFSNNTCPDDTAFVSVHVNPLPVVKASANPAQTIAGTNVLLSAAASGSNLIYRWEPANVVSSPGSKITYWIADNDRTFRINVIDQNNCIATDTVHINVLCDGNKIFVPNAFTPDKATNNRLKPLSPYKNNTFIKRFAVFNRWGGIVYEVKNVFLNQIAGWDGKLSNKNIAQDPNGFVWVLETDCPGMKVNPKKGITLIIR